MFSFLTKLPTRVSIRNMSRRSVLSDPGIERRKKFLNANEELDDDFDDFQSDFMTVHKSHKEHLRELETFKEKEKYHIVGQKYFREKQLNFLTWHDKEQIRYLHNSDPEEWTIEKLSEGFPALPEDIKKIIKSKWSITPKRLISHDKTVQRNWEQFKKGEIKDLPYQLVQHLKKFTNRDLNLKPFELPQKMEVKINTKKPITTEFSDIMTSYQELKFKNKQNEKTEDLTVNINRKIAENDNDVEVKFVSKKRKNKLVTLPELQYKLENKVQSGINLSEDEKLLVKSFRQQEQEEKTIEITQSNVTDVLKNKYETNTSVSLIDKKPTDFGHLIYPQKITIPKEIRKNGYTYKLNDCYYDDDGWFLYRVPGMD